MAGFGGQKYIAIASASAIDLCIMLIGYARISTIEQDTKAQVAALQSAGCELVFREKASGGRWDRPQLHKVLSQLRKGDVLVVWKLDRLSRALRDVLTIMERVQERKAGFRSLTKGGGHNDARGSDDDADGRRGRGVRARNAQGTYQSWPRCLA